MNATKINAEREAVISQPIIPVVSHLRVLSKLQQKQVSSITKDWRKFTSGVFSEMFDKI